MRKLAVWTDQVAFDSWLVTADADKGFTGEFHLTYAIPNRSDSRVCAVVDDVDDAHLLTQAQIDGLMTVQEAYADGFYDLEPQP